MSAKSILDFESSSSSPSSSSITSFGVDFSGASNAMNLDRFKNRLERDRNDLKMDDESCWVEKKWSRSSIFNDTSLLLELTWFTESSSFLQSSVSKEILWLSSEDLWLLAWQSSSIVLNVTNCGFFGFITTSFIPYFSSVKPAVTDSTTRGLRASSRRLSTRWWTDESRCSCRCSAMMSFSDVSDPMCLNVFIGLMPLSTSNNKGFTYFISLATELRTIIPVPSCIAAGNDPLEIDVSICSSSSGEEICLW